MKVNPVHCRVFALEVIPEDSLIIGPSCQELQIWSSYPTLSGSVRICFQLGLYGDTASSCISPWMKWSWRSWNFGYCQLSYTPGASRNCQVPLWHFVQGELRHAPLVQRNGATFDSATDCLLFFHQGTCVLSSH